MLRAEEQEAIDEYRNALLHVVVVATMVGEIDFAKLIRAIDHADTVGPILDPTTLYREKAQAMREDRELFVLAQKLVEKLKRVSNQTRKPMEEHNV